MGEICPPRVLTWAVPPSTQSEALAHTQSYEAKSNCGTRFLGTSSQSYSPADLEPGLFEKSPLTELVVASLAAAVPQATVDMNSCLQTVVMQSLHVFLLSSFFLSH